MPDEKSAMDILMKALAAKKAAKASSVPTDEEMNVDPSVTKAVVESEYERYIRELKEKEG